MSTIVYEDPTTKELRVFHVAHEFSEEDVLENGIPKGSRICHPEPGEIDRDYLSAYRLDHKGKIKFFPEIGKEIQKREWRVARKPLLEKLDIETMKSITDPKALAKVEKEKQALRDVTDTEMPNDLEGIKNTWPEILGPRP